MFSKFHSILIAFCISSVLFLSSCSEQKKNSTHILQINFLSDANNNYCYLYGFIKDKQVLIDSIKINNNQIQYSFAENCSPGVFRIIVPKNQMIDFIYNKEDIEIELDTKNFIENITIIESKENKIFYTFLKEFDTYKNKVRYEQNQLKKIAPSKRKDKIEKVNKTLTENYISLFTRNLQIQATNSMAYSIIKTMYLLDFPKYKALHSSDSISRAEFYSKIYFSKYEISDSRLNDSPFYYIMVKQFLSNTKTFTETELKLALQSLFSISKDKTIIKCIKDYTYQYLLKTKNTLAIEVLAKTYSDACPIPVLYDSTKKHIYFKGTLHSITSLPGISFDFTKESCILFTAKDCNNAKQLDSILYKNSKKLLSKSIVPFVISKEESENYKPLCDTFSIICLPTIICINKQGNITERLYGDIECRNYLTKIVK